MSLHKTPRNKRNTIRYQFYDAAGHKEPLITIIPGRDNITEIDLNNFYAAEDSEVYHNIRTLNPNAWHTDAEKKEMQEQKKKWAQDYIAAFQKKHGYEPNPYDVADALMEAFPKNWTCSLDEMLCASDEENDSDKSRILIKYASTTEPDTPDYIDRLRELVASFPERWQIIYQRVLLYGDSKVQVAADLCISDVRVGQIVRQIKKKIAEDKILKEFFC